MRLYTFLYTITIKMIDFSLSMKSVIEKSISRVMKREKGMGLL